MDHYTVLGVGRTATTDDIRSAYKEKAMKNHPDRGGDPEVWQAIQKAFDTLSDLQRRALYDRGAKDAEGGAERQFQQTLAKISERLAERRTGERGGFSVGDPVVYWGKNDKNKL